MNDDFVAAAENRAVRLLAANTSLARSYVSMDSELAKRQRLRDEIAAIEYRCGGLTDDERRDVRRKWGKVLKARMGVR